MFRRALKALGTSKRGEGIVGGRWVLVPPTADYPRTAVGRRPAAGRSTGTRRPAAERRRQNLTYLAGFIVVTFVLGLIPALKFLLYLNIVACVLLVAYLGAAMFVAARQPSPAPRPRPRAHAVIEDLAPPEAAGGW